MSLGAKQVLTKDFESSLNDSYTVNDVRSIVANLTNVLVGFDVEISNGSYPDSTSEDLLKAFLEAKQIEGKSVKTIERYNYVLRRMLSDLGVPAHKITVYHLRSYLMSERDRGLSDTTVEGMRSVFSSFFVWLQKEGLFETNPCGNISPIKCAKKVRIPFSDTDIERLKESCTTLRDRTLIHFLLSTGCRISELCELNRTSVDFQNGECLLHGKGDKERTAYLDNVTLMLVRRYLSSRKDLCQALFIGKGTERMTPGGVRARLNKIAEKASVENVHPHRFRRTFATNLINRGMPIQDVSFLLGHENLDTTMEYVYIERTNVKNAYFKYA